MELNNEQKRWLEKIKEDSKVCEQIPEKLWTKEFSIEAMKHVSNAVKFETLVYIGYELDAMHLYGCANWLYTEALEIKPDDVETLTSRAYMRLREEEDEGTVDYDYAIEDYTDALKLIPDDISILEGRARAYEELGDKDKAVTDWLAILKIDPDSSIIRSKINKHIEDLKFSLLSMPTNSTIRENMLNTIADLKHALLAKSEDIAAEENLEKVETPVNTSDRILNMLLFAFSNIITGSTGEKYLLDDRWAGPNSKFDKNGYAIPDDIKLVD